MPEELQAINDHLEQVVKEYNEANHPGNKELAIQLRVKINELRKQAHQEDLKHGVFKAGDAYELWIEIHDHTNRKLYKEGNWQVDHGWFESDSMGDLNPDDVAYSHMGGGGLTGICCLASFLLEGGMHTTWFQWWNSLQDEKGALMNCGPEKHHYEVDGRIIRIYVGW